jgi:predicted SpoU family rRNA methylase
LDWYFEHARLEERFPGAKLEIIPMEHGKKVVTA